MQSMSHADTIAAIATPAGAGGVGIVKISGPNAEKIALSLFRRPGHGPDSPPCRLESRKMHYGHIWCPRTKKIVDEVLIVLMKGPGSYTGEDVCEIQAHGGQVVLSRILEMVCHVGAVMALPGEFTKKAFINGRMDLSQAEAVVDIISARTQAAARVAAAQTGGALRRAVEDIVEVLDQGMAIVEASIDFEDNAGPCDTAGLIQNLKRGALAPIRHLIKNSDEGRIHTQGIKAVIVGRPNVGKSSLMNALVGHDRSIVTPISGTTRDVVMESARVGGLYMVLADTAGFRKTDDLVEQIGVDRAVTATGSADVLLIVMDSSQAPEPEDFALVQMAQGKKAILVANKIDLVPDRAAFRPPCAWDGPQACTCAITGQGIDELKSILVKTMCGGLPGAEAPNVVPGLRHAQALEQAQSSVDAALFQAGQGALELATLDLANAKKALCLVTGSTVGPDVLDRIFSRFCVGK